MYKFLSVLCLCGCLNVLYTPALQAAEKQETAVAGKENDNWFETDADADKNIPTEDIQMIAPRPSEIINSGLDEVTSMVAGLINKDSSAVFKPECNNARLIEKVMNRIALFYQEHPANNIMDKRHQSLLLKNLKDFTDVDIASFDPKENYSVSDQLISYKINKGLKNEDMRLCRSPRSPTIYLLIYPKNSQYTIEIINFPGMPVSENFTTVYD